MDRSEHELIEHQVRDVLTSERHVLPIDRVSLDDVYVGAARRRRRRTAVVAGTAVGLLAAAVVPVSLTLLDNGPSHPQTAATTSTSPSPSPTVDDTNITTPTPRVMTPSPSTVLPIEGLPWSGARVTSVTATSTSTLIALGALGDTGACEPPNCLRLAESRDGGKSFTALAVPKDAYADDPDDATNKGATNIRFGSSRDGWLYGGGLWATHDGGRSWARVPIPGRVFELAAAHGTAWALVTTAGGSSAQLWRSPVGSDAWTRVRGVTVGAPGDVVVFGARVVVLGAGPKAEVWTGDGNIFTPHPSPCSVSLAAELSASGSLWAKCVTGTAAYVVTSTDGVDWTRVKATQTGEGPNSLELGARGTADALLALGVDQPAVKLFADGTRRKLSRPPGGSIGYLGFTSPDVGYAINGTALWRTDDGGDTWHVLRIG